MSEDSDCSESRWCQALCWYVTLRDGKKEDLSSTVGLRWVRWHADAENQRIFEEVSRLLPGLGLQRMPARPTQAELAQDRYDLSVSIAEWHKAWPFRTNRNRGSSA